MIIRWPKKEGKENKEATNKEQKDKVENAPKPVRKERGSDRRPRYDYKQTDSNNKRINSEKRSNDRSSDRPKESLTKFSQYQRVGVFVDVQNMFYSAKHIQGAKLDFMKLMKKAVRNRQLIRAVCYVIENPDVDQYNFIEMLKSNGYEIKSKELRSRADGSSKGDWDMGIAVDAISLAEKLDIVVLVSGDGDFTDLVYHLKSRGCLVEAISFMASTNEDLINAVDVHIPIEKDMLLQNRRSS